jgi:bacillithiol synthase
MTTIRAIPFRAIPHQSNLFLRYLDLSPEALAFYQRPATIDNLVQAAGVDLSGRQFHRSQIASILRRQNLKYGADTLANKYIEELQHSDCVAILTGQQVSLFTGPLYTVYKAFSAIRIAEQLRGLGIRAVPVFWMDTEDHDLAEATHRTVIASDSSPQVIDYRQLLFGGVSDPLQSVGSIRLPENVQQAVQECIQPSGAKHEDEVRQYMEATYRAGNSFAEAFGQLMARLFKGYGLILFDPQDADAKNLLIPVYRKAVLQAEQIYRSLLERSAALESGGFHAQVNIPENSTVLFYQSRGERRPLIRHNAGFALKGTDTHFSQDELLAQIESFPELFSPNVLLRPLAQDHLFPTAAYVGGPAEIAYFAQIEALYRLFNRPMPAIWPRCSFTLIEPEIGTRLDQYSLDLADCFRGKNQMTEKALKSMSPSRAGTILDELREDIDSGFDELRPGLTAADSSLGTAMETAKRKILHHVDSLKVKFTQLDARHSGSVLEDVHTIFNYCYPNGNLQERELCIVDFLARQGLSLMDTIYSAVRVDNFDHGIIRLDPFTEA